jgi:hypothetical protein
LRKSQDFLFLRFRAKIRSRKGGKTEKREDGEGDASEN